LMQRKPQRAHRAALLLAVAQRMNSDNRLREEIHARDAIDSVKLARVGSLAADVAADPAAPSRRLWYAVRASRRASAEVDRILFGD
jgi:hypothetical protein